MAISPELKLMLLLMKTLSEKFRSKAVLRGGMALYLLNSRRYTNDLDYAFVPYNSKKDLVEPILKVLSDIDGLKVENQNLNSKCFRIEISKDGVKCQLEIKAYKDLPSLPITTDSVDGLNIPPFVVRIADLNWSLANKLVAWWERRIGRDLYDIYFMASRLNALPDRHVLLSRLKKLQYARGVSGTKSFSDLSDFAEELQTATLAINWQVVTTELRDYFEAQEIIGIELKIQHALNKISEYVKDGLNQDFS